MIGRMKAIFVTKAWGFAVLGKDSVGSRNTQGANVPTN